MLRGECSLHCGQQVKAENMSRKEVIAGEDPI